MARVGLIQDFFRQIAADEKFLRGCRDLRSQHPDVTLLIADKQVEGGNELSGAVGVSVTVSSDDPQENSAESVLRGMGGCDGHEELVSEGEPFGRRRPRASVEC